MVDLILWFIITSFSISKTSQLKQTLTNWILMNLQSIFLCSQWIYFNQMHKAGVWKTTDCQKEKNTQMLFFTYSSNQTIPYLLPTFSPSLEQKCPRNIDWVHIFVDQVKTQDDITSLVLMHVEIFFFFLEMCHCDISANLCQNFDFSFKKKYLFCLKNINLIKICTLN